MNEEINQRLKAQVDEIAGQIETIEKLLNADCACLDVLARIAEIRTALGALINEMLTEYVKSCLSESDDGTAGVTGKSKAQRLAEVQAVLQGLLR